MNNPIDTLIDERGGKSVYDGFYTILEKARLTKKHSVSKKTYQYIEDALSRVENGLQDLNEKNSSMKGNSFIVSDNILLQLDFDGILKNTNDLLKNWLILFSSTYQNEEICEALFLNFELLNHYLKLDAKIIVATYFDLKLQPSELYKNKAQHFYHDTANNHKEFLLYLNANIVSLSKNLKSPSDSPISILASNYLRQIGYNKQLEDKMISSAKNIKILSDDDQEQQVEDGENTLYIGDLKLWIDSNDAEEVNRFLHIVTSVISSIENVELTITDAGIGSFFQRLRIKFKGWFAKEETQQLLKKSGKAAQAYVLDRHAEPVKKSKLERVRTQADIDRLQTVDNAKELNEIEVEKAREELTSKKLDNMQKRLDIMKNASEMLASGLLNIDSDFRIEIGDLTLIEKKDNKINLGDFKKFDTKLTKELLPPEETDTESSPK